MDTIARLKNILKEKNLTVAAVGRLAGLGRNTLQTTINRGGQLSVDTIERICDALNITIAEFFTEPPETASLTVVADNPLTDEELRILREMIKERSEKNK